MAGRYYDNVFDEKGWEALPQFSDLKGKTVFITGGGSGIGAFFTAAFALQGANVGFVSLTKDSANKLCDSVEEQTGLRPLYVQCDIRDIDALKSAIRKVKQQYGGIDVLINNAARDIRHTVESFTVEDWDDSIQTNLRPHFFAVQSVVAEMKEVSAGSIINVGSNSYNLGLSGYPTYVTAKGGIVAMTRALARELGPDNIRVNALIPGWVLTERQKRLWVNDENLKACLDQQSLKTAMNGWDMASPALFLASTASAMMSGQEMIVDGGRA